MKIQGISAHRLTREPQEKAFADAWARQCKQGNTLSYLLDESHGAHGRPADPSDRDQVVAATVIQWLGSPVGQSFLADLGYEKKTRK